MKVTVYVEGGGDRRKLKTECRYGFRAFLHKAGLAGRMPAIFAGGGRQKTYGSFCAALAQAADNEFIVLLVDSEDPVAEGAGPWTHLQTRDKWQKPAAATDENAHLMTQCMEAWFFADKDALAAYFGAGFKRNALSARAEIENIPKTDVESGLKAATKPSRKGKYNKSSHSFDVLARLDPEKVADASPRAKRLLRTLKAKA